MLYRATANIGFGDTTILKSQSISEKDFKKVPDRLKNRFAKVQEANKLVEVKSEGTTDSKAKAEADSKAKAESGKNNQNSKGEEN